MASSKQRLTQTTDSTLLALFGRLGPSYLGLSSPEFAHFPIWGLIQDKKPVLLCFINIGLPPFPHLVPRESGSQTRAVAPCGGSWRNVKRPA